MDSATLMAAHALEFAMAVPAAVMALAPVRGFLRIDARRVYALAGMCLVILVVAGASACSTLRIPTNLVLVPCACLLFLPYARLVALPLPKKLFCFGTAAMLCAFSTLWASIAAAPWEAGNAEDVLLPQSGALTLGIAAVLCAIFARTLLVKLPALMAQEAIGDSWKLLAPVPFLATAVLCWLVPWDLSLALLGRSYQIYLTVTTVFPAVAWLLLHIAWRVMSDVVDAGRLRQEVAILRMEEHRLADLRGYVDQTREMRHDFRHHLQAMRGMLDAGDMKSLDDYLAQLAGAEEAGSRPTLCANAAVDAVAAHYDAEARRRGVVVRWRLEVPEEEPVPEVDLCSVLGNLVENSVEAVSTAEGDERWVEVVAREVTPEAMGITVRNPLARPLSLGDDGLPVADRPGHGVGLASVKSVAERHGGTLDVRVEGGEVLAGVILFHGKAPS